MKGNTINLKFVNTKDTFKDIFTTISNADAKVYNTKVNNFTGGDSGIATISVSPLNDKDQVANDLKKIKDIIDITIA